MDTAMIFRCRRICLMLVCFAVALAFLPGLSDNYNVHAAKKVKKMKVYQCIKSGDTVYCSNDFHIFKVDLNTEDVTIMTGGACYPNKLYLKGKYLYYRDSFQGFDLKGYCGYLYRINVETMTKKKLAPVDMYAIQGNKIYYTVGKLKGNNIKTYKKVMELDGKSKKKTKYTAKNSYKDTNTAGYYVTDDVDWGDYDQPASYYLSTPYADILLETLPSPII